MIVTIVILSLLLVISVVVNGFLIWFNREAIGKLLFVSNNVVDTMGLIEEYNEHLESLYEMEMFYGDATLKGLIDHTKFVLAEMKKFEQVYTLTVDGDIDDYPPEEEA
jgi:hypothetical protein